MIVQAKYEWGDKEIPFFQIKDLEQRNFKEDSMIIEPVKYARDLTFWEDVLNELDISYAVYLVEYTYKEKGIVKSNCGFTIVIDTEKHSVNFTV